MGFTDPGRKKYILWIRDFQFTLNNCGFAGNTLKNNIFGGVLMLDDVEGSAQQYKKGATGEFWPKMIFIIQQQSEKGEHNYNSCSLDTVGDLLSSSSSSSVIWPQLFFLSLLCAFLSPFL